MWKQEIRREHNSNPEEGVQGQKVTNESSRELMFCAVNLLGRRGGWPRVINHVTFLRSLLTLP